MAPKILPFLILASVQICFTASLLQGKPGGGHFLSSLANNCDLVCSFPPLMLHQALLSCLSEDVDSCLPLVGMKALLGPG